MKRAKAAVCLMLILAAIVLAGCGKKNAPQPPPGTPNTYPRTYPRE
jgi:predicted small lipoprotein YifL